jgi:phosphopantothenoylcysteine decarboxylase/phosphopantothenate--cysteine ligase
MRILLTAGPTREPIDEVRFISNRSSGKMGVSLARAAAERGHQVLLLLGQGTVEPPPGLPVERFETNDDLRRLLEAHFGACDALIMAAAVSDYRPARAKPGKMPRSVASDVRMRLRPTVDLVALAAQRRQPNQIVVAFALEAPEHIEHRAAEKLREKGVDAIVANPLKTMEADDVEPLWLTANGQREAPGRMPKSDFGPWLIERVERLASNGKSKIRISKS